MKSIHQFVDTIAPGDAISSDCMQINACLAQLGFTSYIYARSSLIHHPMIRSYRTPVSANAGIIFHHSTYSPIVQYVTKLPNKKILIYHNITPAAFFREYNYELFKIFREAERQNYLLSDSKFAAIIGDSQHNLSQISQFLQAKHKAVFPPFLYLQFKPHAHYELEKNGNEFSIMFVGRFAPNKRQNDIVKVFEYYSKFINPQAHLYLIGTYSYIDPYFNEILSYIRERHIQNITIEGALSSEDLAHVYKNADLFLSMSEHEGFCIPVLESIHFNVPVLAYKIPALEELLDEEYLFSHKNYKAIGNMIYNIQVNKKYKEIMITEQKKILNKFLESEVKSEFKVFISKVFHV